MGFTPTSGLVMSTRSGDIDPSVVLYLAEQKRLRTRAIRHLLNSRAGLLGVSGLTADMERLLDRYGTDIRAREAVDLYCYQAQKHLAALTVALGGLDTIVFTAGIGENSAKVRNQICAGLGHFGVELDARRNARNAEVISSPHSAVQVRVVRTDEERMIAEHALNVWNASSNRRS
jgi:acetate kinase